jgi:hypothetical protein
VTLVRIDRRFRGPPDSGNGGYFAGLVAGELGGSDVVVTLRQPAPLDADLRLERSRDEALLYADDRLLAVAARKPVVIDVPAPPSLEDARAAELKFRPDRHLYPGCFVCGPDRDAGDGLRIFAGATGPRRVSASWTPTDEFADQHNAVRIEIAWAALDCPGYFAVQEAAGLALLGRIAVRIDAPIPVGSPLIVSGWGAGSEGRKHRACTALHAADGRLLAVAEQTWISLN